MEAARVERAPKSYDDDDRETEIEGVGKGDGVR